MGAENKYSDGISVNTLYRGRYYRSISEIIITTLAHFARLESSSRVNGQTKSAKLLREQTSLAFSICDSTSGGLGWRLMACMSHPFSIPATQASRGATGHHVIIAFTTRIELSIWTLRRRLSPRLRQSCRIPNVFSFFGRVLCALRQNGALRQRVHCGIGLRCSIVSHCSSSMDQSEMHISCLFPPQMPSEEYLKKFRQIRFSPVGKTLKARVKNHWWFTLNNFTTKWWLLIAVVTCHA